MHTVVRLDVSPLGAGALAGSSLALDPDAVAADLGFAGRFENSLDAVSDRDFVAEALFDLALLGVHLSRIGEELVLWSTEEFGFVTLDDAYATGSSMLPQKKNPDVAELARGKAGRLIGHLTGMLATLKGLPLAYNRDLQEDKEPLFDAVDQISRALVAMTGMLATAQFDTERMRTAADGAPGAAVDLAEWLVERGVPFRQAHSIVGSLVRDSLQRGVPLAELVQAHPALGTDALGLLEPGVAVTRRTSPGGAGPGPVAVQTERFGHRIELDRERVAHALDAASSPRTVGGAEVAAVGVGRPGLRPRTEAPRDRIVTAGAARRRPGAVPGRRRPPPLLRRRPGGGGPPAAEQAPGPGDQGGPDRRGGGLPGRRGPGLPRLRRPHQAQRHHVRPTRSPLRLFHLRDALVRQRRLRTGGDGPRRAPAGPGPGVGSGGHAPGPSGGNDRPPADERSGQALPGLRDHRRPRTGPTW